MRGKGSNGGGNGAEKLWHVKTEKQRANLQSVPRSYSSSKSLPGVILVLYVGLTELRSGVSLEEFWRSCRNSVSITAICTRSERRFCVLSHYKIPSYSVTWFIWSVRPLLIEWERSNKKITREVSLTPCLPCRGWWMSRGSNSTSLIQI